MRSGNRCGTHRAPHPERGRPVSSVEQHEPQPTVPGAQGPADDPREPIALLLRDLRARPGGLSTREAENRLLVSGPNELVRRGGPQWWREVIAQLIHPLALLLWGAAALALAVGSPVSTTSASSSSTSSCTPRRRSFRSSSSPWPAASCRCL